MLIFTLSKHMNKTKKLVGFTLLAFLLLWGVSCNEQTTYAEELKAEQRLIDAFLERNGIHVLQSWPQDSVFMDNEYVLLDNGIYFQLTDKGSGTDTARYGKDLILVRYLRYSLNEYADTTNYMQLDYPVSFKFGDYNDESACAAFHEAVYYMKRTDAQARMIVPSKMGFSSDMRPATPYGYDLKIRIKR